MASTSKKIGWWIFALLCISIGLYPVIYFVIDGNFGLLESKSEEILNSPIWNAGFYGHIVFGGLALLVGWMQFSKKLRLKRVQLHRNIGKFYVVTVLISGVCALFIGFFATGGIITSMGFISLGLVWLTTTIAAYFTIRKGNVLLHQKLMIFSYAACFAAVTLRIWLPVLIAVLGEFELAYKIVAWLCWVPNIFVAALIVRKI